MQRMQAVYHCDYRPRLTGSQPWGLPLPFILGLTEAKVVYKINMLTRQTYSNAQPPFGIICQLLQVCLYVQVHSRQL